MNLYKKYTAKPYYSFLVFDTTLASHNPLHFTEELVERILEVIMAIDDKTSDEKLQYEKLQYCNIKTGDELFTNEMKNDKIKNKIDEIKCENKIFLKCLKHEGDKYIYIYIYIYILYKYIYII